MNQTFLILKPDQYKLGIGDTLSFVKLIENQNTKIEKADNLLPPKMKRPYILGIGDQIALIQVNEQSSNSPNLSGANQNTISTDGNISALAALESLSNEKDVLQTTGG